jgi:hypothetical protein
MADVKKVGRDVQHGFKKSVCGLDGTSPKDRAGNTGDAIRKDLGNAGDAIRRPVSGPKQQGSGDQTQSGTRLPRVRSWGRRRVRLSGPDRAGPSDQTPTE